MGLGGIPSQVKKFVPRFAGKLAVAFVVKRLGYGGSSFGGVRSDLGGAAWNWQQYLAAVGIALYGPKLFGRFVNGAEFAEGAWDLIFTKLVWTEGIGRSDWAVNQFGDGGVVQVAPSGASYLQQGGDWVSMQGGTLVDAGALDGGTLVDAGALDGIMVEGNELDGSDDVVYPGEVIPVSGYAQSYHANIYGE